MIKLPIDTDPDVRKAVEELQRGSQQVGHRLFLKKPLLAEIPEGGFVLADDAGAFFVYTKIKGKRYRAALILDP